jgi:hypothetical protein
MTLLPDSRSKLWGLLFIASLALDVVYASASVVSLSYHCYHVEHVIAVRL